MKLKEEINKKITNLPRLNMKQFRKSWWWTSQENQQGDFRFGFGATCKFTGRSVRPPVSWPCMLTDVIRKADKSHCIVRKWSERCFREPARTSRRRRNFSGSHGSCRRNYVITELRAVGRSIGSRKNAMFTTGRRTVCRRVTCGRSR